jgi:DNA-directed RNA polymerase subunit M/transcription elongation factor TFIIS
MQKRSGRRMYRPRNGEKWICAKCGREIKIDNKNKKIYLKTNKKELNYEALKEIELEIKKFFVNYKIEILNY